MRGDGWLHVRYGGLQGFASAALLTPQLSFHKAAGMRIDYPIAVTPTPSPAPTPSPTPSPSPSPDGGLRLVFNTAGSIVRLRGAPDEAAALLGILPNGTPVQLLGAAQDGWILVQAGALQGYLPADALAGR